MIVTMFSKLMDTQSEDVEKDRQQKVNIGGLDIGSFLFVDDVLTIAEAYTQQKVTMDAICEFGMKQKLNFSAEKSALMEIGHHKEAKEKWELGEKQIMKCRSYKYLGDWLERNDSNLMNIEKRIRSQRWRQ